MKYMLSSIFALMLFPVMFPLSADAAEEARLFRFPAIFGKQVVFSYAGDLYTVSSEGGDARKLTSHDGYEMFPRFSPDGKYIAFTGQYDGNTEVYLVKADGGVPKRLTYTANLSRDDVADRMGPNNIVMGWNGDEIIFRSRMHSHDPFVGKLFSTTVNGDMHRQLPLPRGGFCSFAPDGSRMAYNRVFREFRTWKRYRGGMADDVRLYDFKTKKTTNITNNPAQDIFPMWHGTYIYYISDRGPHGRMNLYVYDLQSQQTRRLTDFNEFDIKFPSLGDDAIVFENAGYIYRFDIASEKATRLTIHLNDDRIHARGGIKNVKKFVTDAHLSPSGKRVIMGARGELFSLPAKYGAVRNLTKSSGFHERNSQWSPDGRWVAFISDQTGENEIFIVAPDGVSKPLQLTYGADNYKFNLLWSPDSKKILWSDSVFKLHYVDVQTKKTVTVDASDYAAISAFDWSPDSRWIAYAKNHAQDLRQIILYSVGTGQPVPVTDVWYDSNSPVFSRCGKYLYFVSSRDFNPTEGQLEMRYVFPDMERLYLVTLAKETASPFTLRSDEESAELVKGDKSAAEAKKKTPAVAAAETALKVDIDGLSARIVVLPAKASRYRNLWSVEDKLYYLRKGRKEEDTRLLMLDLNSRKEVSLGTADDFSIAAAGKTMLIKRKDDYAVIDLPTSKPDLSETLRLDDLEMELCPPCEWKNIFYESWRHLRDFFYVKNMHGVDWPGMRDRYAALLPYVAHRNDLTYIIGEMIGELNVGHAYVGGGERPDLQKVNVGLLAVDLERDAATGFYKITRILEGRNWDEASASPLTEVGVNAAVGDYIIKIDGISTAQMNNPYKALNNKADKQVQLTLNSKPAIEGGRNVLVKPTADVSQVYYYNWVRENIRKVDAACGGKVGYLHIPDMSEEGLSAFIKLYIPQLRKQALIVDVRGNGGGFVSELITERLRREIVFFDMGRNMAHTVNPQGMLYGPMVCLQDEFSASDGDIFPYRFRAYKLGKLIGKRTWGGVVGINDSLPFLDGGQLYTPGFASYDLEGKKWIIEGVGVEPDIFVDNDPAAEFAGEDQQLNRAVIEILEALKTSSKKLLPPPADPDKH